MQTLNVNRDTSLISANVTACIGKLNLKQQRGYSTLLSLCASSFVPNYIWEGNNFHLLYICLRFNRLCSTHPEIKILKFPDISNYPLFKKNKKNKNIWPDFFSIHLHLISAHFDFNTSFSLKIEYFCIAVLVQKCQNDWLKMNTQLYRWASMPFMFIWNSITVFVFLNV